MAKKMVLAASLQINSDGKGLTVEFGPIGNRLGHTISDCEDGISRPLLRSDEGGDDDTVPPSPPFTVIHQQDHTVYLTGATTLGHWSMSVATVENTLMFDVACRLKARASRLGSEYQVLASNCRDVLDVEFENADFYQSTRNSDRVRIEPSVSQPTSFPATMQWRYSISLRG